MSRSFTRNVTILLSFISILFLSAPMIGNAQTVTVHESFARNLRQGDFGTDVYTLQKFLNTDQQTKVADSGAGSTSFETTYFGPATKRAVIKFQEKYAAEVLAPSGLFSGTGFVGPATRKKLNALNITQTQTTNIATTSPATLNDIPNVGVGGAATLFEGTSGVEIMIPSPYAGAVGTPVSLFGSGFQTTENTIVFGTLEIPHLSTQSSTLLSFTVPDLPAGKYPLTIKNSAGQSTHPSFFMITIKNASAPKIISATPASGVYGDEVTLSGEGFTQANNEILTNYGRIPNIPSADGKTLKFNVLPFPEIPELKVGVNLHRDIKFTVTIYILNTNGITKDPAHFILNI